ncbi:MAG TPA: cyclic nucleotide-binding domain-containing protein [Planctomycetaceae bacterium]
MGTPQSEFLRGVPDEVRDRLARLALRRTFPAGTTMFVEGNRHDEFHLVEAGQVRLEMSVPRRGRVPILTIGPGDVLAWSAVLGGGVMTATAVAVGTVVTAAFDGPALRRLCEAEPAVGYHVMRQLSSALSRRLVATRLQLLDLFAPEQPATRPVP